MKCERCPLEDSCPELKKLSDVKGCPLELAIAFILVVANAFGQKKK